MRELELKYGCNPNQKPSRIFIENGQLPIEILNGRPGYINLLDAFNGYQLVKELHNATGKVAATSFKHVSPAGAAIGMPLSDIEKILYRVEDLDIEFSPMACAYARARGADRMSSFGDFISLSDTCDVATAMILKREVSDGIIAPSYEPEAIEILKQKKKGAYCIIKIDSSYEPEPIEHKQVFGISFEQGRNDKKIDAAFFENIVTKNKDLPKEALDDLIVAMISLKYTQSNSVAFAKDGMAIGIGAGQQSRIHCTRLAASKVDVWRLRAHPRVMELPFVSDIPRAVKDNAIDNFVSGYEDDVLKDGAWQKLFTSRPEALSAKEKAEWIGKLDGVSFGSDAFFPFSDNIERAKKSGAKYIAQPGGSVRDDEVIAACDKHNMVMAFTGLRLFHH